MSPRRPDLVESPPNKTPTSGLRAFGTGCQYCVVGCGYEAILWPDGDGANVIPAREQGNWVSPAMTERVSLDGQAMRAAILPDPKCPMNRGNHSSRGGTQGRDLVTLAAADGSVTDSVRERIRTPYVRVADAAGERFEPVSQEVAAQIVGRLVAAAAEAQADPATKTVRFRRPAGLGVKIFEYQYLENTYAATKLFFQLVGTPNVAFHDRPSIASNTQGCNDTGIDPHGWSYDDLHDSDVILLAGSNPYETQSVLFMNYITGKRLIVIDPRKTITADYAEKTGGLHLQPTVLGADVAVLNALCRHIRDQRGAAHGHWGANRVPHPIVARKADQLDPFRAAVAASPPDPALGPESGRLAKFLLSFEEFEAFLEAQPDLAEAAVLSGIPLEKLETAARWLSGPEPDLPDPANRKVSLIFEKGLIWGFSYSSTAAFANLGLYLGSVLEPPPQADQPQPAPVRGVTGRAGGHQKGWTEVRYNLERVQPDGSGAALGTLGYPFYNATDRFDDGVTAFPTHHYFDCHLVGTGVAPRHPLHKGPDAPDIKLLWVIGSNAAGQVGNAEAKWAEVARRRAGPRPSTADPDEVVRVLSERMAAGGLVVVQQDIYPNPTTLHADVVLAAAGWGEADMARFNGERRLRLYSRFQDSPAYDTGAGLEIRCAPDWRIFQAVAQRTLEAATEGANPQGWRAHGLPDGYRFAAASHALGAEDFAWTDAAALFREMATSGNLARDLEALEAGSATAVGHARLRERRSTGYVLPLGANLTESVRRKVASRTKLGKDINVYAFVAADWNALKDDFAAHRPRREMGEVAVCNGRINELWNSLFTHSRNATVRARYPDDLPGTILEVGAALAGRLGLSHGDIVDLEATDIPYGAASASMRGTVVLQPAEVLPENMVFAYFSWPAYEGRLEEFPFRTYRTDAYVNNLTSGWLDPVNQIAAVKFARARISRTGAVYHAAPSFGAAAGLNERARHVSFAVVPTSATWWSRKAWKVRELIVQRGVPRIRVGEHSWSVGGSQPQVPAHALITDPDAYMALLSRPDAAGQRARNQLSGAANFMEWPPAWPQDAVVDKWSATDLATLQEWLAELNL